MKGFIFRAYIMILLSSVMLQVFPVHAQTPQPSDQQISAQSILEKMSPEEKVGQLFLVTFKGTDVSPTSQIFDLITKRYIGGVILSAENNNFPESGNQLTGVFQLTQSLQTARLDQAEVQSGMNKIPLFIGISQEGDLFPYDQIVSGLTSLPSEMAIGATWNPELSQKVGSVLGNELRRLGINLLIGPSMDVLDRSSGPASEDLGVRTFGGNPYWVGEMGKAYISGLHQGAEGRMTVISKHFPGRGSSDRSTKEEVAAVRKPLDELLQLELRPFFAITNPDIEPDQITDGMFVAHIRYQGIQGSIRSTTKPISFDADAIAQLMSFPQIKTWRENGGLLVSDDLGSAAIRKFFDPSGVSFDSRQIARNALLSGNDLLYINNFVSSGDPDSYTSIVKTLEFFAQKYREDQAFAQIVDNSVNRILQQKYSMYQQFSRERILLQEAGLSRVGDEQQVSFEVAQHAVTLISPSKEELTSVLPRPPERLERIVFITDVVTGQQCANCSDQVTMPVDALQKAVLKLYGPQAGGQVVGGRLSSYSFTDLENLLTGIEGSETFAAEIREATWIVFSFQKINSDRPVSMAMKRFLSDRPDLIRNKKLIAFAFNAPYYLDSTDISKLTAYYGVFSKIPSFVDISARVLFQEMSPTGILPVGVDGAGYDLVKATSPNPAQIISISLDLPEPISISGTPENKTITPTMVPLFNVGDNLPLKTGVIIDRNGKPVPDGTQATFIFTLGDEKKIIQQEEVETIGGIARTTFRIQDPGLLDIRVRSGSAISSQILRLDVSGSGGAQITAIAPTPIPTETVEPTPTVSPTPQIEPTITSGEIRAHSFGGWLAGLMLLVGLVIAAYQLVKRMISVRWGVRYSLVTALVGSLGLVVYGLSPIGNPFPDIWSALLFTFAGCVIGCLCAWIWFMYPKWMEVKPD